VNSIYHNFPRAWLGRPVQPEAVSMAGGGVSSVSPLSRMARSHPSAKQPRRAPKISAPGPRHHLSRYTAQSAMRRAAAFSNAEKLER